MLILAAVKSFLIKKGDPSLSSEDAFDCALDIIQSGGIAAKLAHLISDALEFSIKDEDSKIVEEIVMGLELLEGLVKIGE